MIKLIGMALAFLILPLFNYCQTNGIVKVYSVGNVSVKINASKDTLINADKLTWLEKSALAFSDNEQELYFRHPTDQYYQVWNTNTKQKTAEIPFSQAATTAEGRRIISLFHNTAYPSDLFMNTKIWISEDLSISFNKKYEFTISSLQNTPDRKFVITPRGYAFESNFIGYEKFVKKYHLQMLPTFLIITNGQINSLLL